ncbi:MAG: beta-ketoacyl-[acyl-carrier-protein] synthase family protein [Planctomycetaceae bacterium]|jgi:3-oxoacyl-[acyl-carrier-protein] synthase II|nr:beta-ketoacyl-[acyl-carrier-protein] synthase family protein [Planctomycetaceae bacterium]
MYKEVVITGFGLLSPVGNDKETFWAALMNENSGIGFLNIVTKNELLRPMGGEILEFNAKDYVKPRKNIKVMSRDIQLALVASAYAAESADLITDGENRTVESDRLGVMFGSDLIGVEVELLLNAFRVGIKDGQYDFSRWGIDAMSEVFPLWMLKYLPNMPSCHISILHGAHAPSNSLTLCRGSSLAAVMEAARTIQRGAADVMIAGGCGNRVNQDFQTRINAYFPAKRNDNPSTVLRPFDINRNGTVLGEGAAAFILESREFAEARGAKILATIRGFASTNEPKLHNERPTGIAIKKAIKIALERANMKPGEIGFVNADGIGVQHDDKIESVAIREELGDVMVSANKGNFGDLGSGTGAVELAAALLSLQKNMIPPTCNHERTDPDCPINVVHKKPEPLKQKTTLKLNQTRMGRSFAIIISSE